ncbi:MAG: NAD-dependent epimerase/dehydratase family protein, partial [Sciscionella sp.]
LHADDAVAVLRRAVRLPSSGVFNVAGAGVLTLSQAVARSGRLPLPMPRRVIRPLSRLVRGSKPADFGAEHLRYLNFGRVLDTGKLRHEFGYSPQFSTQRAFDDYLSGRDSPPRMATTIS